MSAFTLKPPKTLFLVQEVMVSKFMEPTGMSLNLMSEGSSADPLDTSSINSRRMSAMSGRTCMVEASRTEVDSAWKSLQQSRPLLEKTKLAFDYRPSLLSRVSCSTRKVYAAEPLDMRMSDPDIIETFTYLVTELKNRHPKMAYLHAGEPRVGGGNDLVAAEGDSLEFLVSAHDPNTQGAELMPYSTKSGLINP
jgi:hypothetical protein